MNTDRQTPSSPTESTERSPLAGALGLVLPGLGLAVRGDIFGGLLALAAVVHCIALGICSLAAVMSRGDMVEDATTAARTALQSGILSPQAAMMWVLALAVHLGAAWSAWSAFTPPAAKETNDPAPAD